MSIPSCIRPQRSPNPLVTGPLTGQPRPPDGAAPLPDAPPDCEARIFAAIAALCASSAFTSDRYSSFDSRTDESADSLSLRASASSCCVATRLLRTRSCSLVRVEICRVTARTPARTLRVLFRVSCSSSFAPFTVAAINSSCRPIAFENSTWSTSSPMLDAASTTETASGGFDV